MTFTGYKLSEPCVILEAFTRVHSQLTDDTKPYDGYNLYN